MIRKPGMHWVQKMVICLITIRDGEIILKNTKKYIEEACTHLPDLHLYAVDQMVGTKQYIEELSLEPWFHERVFDIYLWHMGSKVRKEW